MKIGILTQPLHANYGGILQNYALQQVLIRAGYETETIDWEGGKGIREALYRVKMEIAHAAAPSKFPSINYRPNTKEQNIIQQNTKHFIDTYIKHTKKLHSHAAFAKQARKGGYDAYIVGSDQCWRPCYNTFLSAMFLDFVQDRPVKRVAYAASLGTDRWEYTPRQTATCAPLAQRFDLVTVREDSGVKLCKEYLGTNAIHVLDPTMLLTKEDYIRIVETEKEPKPAGTLFCYILDPNNQKTAFIQRVEKTQGLQSFQVLPKCQAENRTKEDIKNRIEDCVFPSVTAWIRAFIDAEMTIVDSFHGMVFSIIFNKPFWAIGNEGRGVSRFISLLKMFHLEDRLLNASHLDGVDLSKPIDWSSVNTILSEMRNKSKALLLNELKK